METETEVKELTSEDVVKIVEEVLDKRESRSKSKPAQSEAAASEIDVDVLAKKVGELVAAALDLREAKQAEEAARAKAEAEKKASDQSGSAKKKSSPYDF